MVYCMAEVSCSPSTHFMLPHNAKAQCKLEQCSILENRKHSGWVVLLKRQRPGGRRRGSECNEQAWKHACSFSFSSPVNILFSWFGETCDSVHSILPLCLSWTKAKPFVQRGGYHAKHPAVDLDGMTQDLPVRISRASFGSCLSCYFSIPPCPGLALV